MNSDGGGGTASGAPHSRWLTSVGGVKLPAVGRGGAPGGWLPGVEGWRSGGRRQPGPGEGCMAASGTILADAGAVLGDAIWLVFGRLTAMQMAVENQWPWVPGLNPY